MFISFAFQDDISKDSQVLVYPIHGTQYIWEHMKVVQIKGWFFWVLADLTSNGQLLILCFIDLSFDWCLEIKIANLYIVWYVC